MAELVGSNAYIKWECTAGTVTISTDFRTWRHSDNIDAVDKSAGADARRTYIKTLKDGNISASFLHDGGTALWEQLDAGVDGTLTWGEAGTASGAPKHVQPAFITKSELDTPYDNLQIWNLEWRPTADRTDSTW